LDGVFFKYAAAKNAQLHRYSSQGDQWSASLNLTDV